MSVEKPIYPDNVSSWWRKKMDELTDEQKEIKRAYYRQYSAWQRSQKAQKPKTPRKPKADAKLPDGVSGWWNLPMEELTPEQREIKREYNRKYQKEYYDRDRKREYYEKNYEEIRKKDTERQRIMREKAKKYDEIVG